MIHSDFLHPAPQLLTRLNKIIQIYEQNPAFDPRSQ